MGIRDWSLSIIMIKIMNGSVNRAIMALDKYYHLSFSATSPHHKSTTPSLLSLLVSQLTLRNLTTQMRP